MDAAAFRKAARRYGAAAVGGGLMFTLAACGSDEPGGSGAGDGGAGELKVVVIADQSGPYAGNGNPVAAGTTSAAEALKASGKGPKVTISFIDSLSTPEGAQAAAQRAVAEQPDFIIAGTSAGPLAAAAATFNSANIPVLAITTLPVVDNTFPKWGFAFVSTPNQFPTYLIAGAKQLLGGSLQGKRVAMNGLVNPGVDEYIKVLNQKVPAEGATFGPVERDPLTLASYTSQAAKLAAAKPDVVFNITSTTNTPIVTQELIQAGITEAPILVIETAATDAVLSTAAAPNLYAARAFKVPEKGDELYAAAEAAKQASDPAKVAHPYFSAGWSALYLAAASAEKCGASCSNYIEAFENLGPYDIPGKPNYGKLEFSKDRHQGVSAVQYFTWDAAAGKSKPYGDPVETGNP